MSGEGALSTPQTLRKLAYRERVLSSIKNRLNEFEALLMIDANGSRATRPRRSRYHFFLNDLSERRKLMSHNLERSHITGVAKLQNGFK
jgi:hypothetical protein